MASIDPVDPRQSPGCSTAKSVLVRYEAEIACYAAHLTCDRAEADALYQETMLQARNGFDGVERAANYRLWLYTIATGTFLSDRGRSGPNGSGDEWQAAEARDTIPNHINPRGVPDLLPKMEEFAASLPRRQWAALVQRVYHDQSYADIAATLGCSERAARDSVYEALRTLRVHFADRF